MSVAVAALKMSVNADAVVTLVQIVPFCSGSPMAADLVVSGPAVKGERSESAGHEVPLTGAPTHEPSDVGRTEPVPDRLLTVDEAAAAMNTTVRFVRRLIAERRICFHHLGRHIRIRESDIERFVAQGRVPVATHRGSGYTG